MFQQCSISAISVALVRNPLDTPSLARASSGLFLNSPASEGPSMPIQNLSTHPAHYLTVAELADYWSVSRQQIYKLIETGALEAVRLSARVYRVPAAAALEHERRTSVSCGTIGNPPGRGMSEVRPVPVRATIPDKIGLVPVRKVF